MTVKAALLTAFAALLALAPSQAAAQSTEADSGFRAIEQSFQTTQRAAIRKYCLDCHSAAEKQGEFDLERFASVADMQRDPAAWQRVLQMLDTGEMPPEDAEQPTREERQALRHFVRQFLDAVAKASAGDPGPVVLRRLNNAEYTYTIQDLTGVPLQPAREFPADSAAGEGFTNVGSALAMSPAMLEKYLDAAKEIAGHAVLLPHGIEFSPGTSPRDWTDEKLAAIRGFYDRYSDSGGSTAVNLQGIRLETNGGGRLPLERYLRATLEERDALIDGTTTIAEVARWRQLNEKYLQTLWLALSGTDDSLLLDRVRAEWKAAGTDDVDGLAASIGQWQQALWRFATVGHIGKRDGPPSWQVPVSPLAERTEIRLPMPQPREGNIKLYLVASDCGDGREHDFAVWHNPRFVAPGQPDLPLRDARRIAAALREAREKVLGGLEVAFSAAAEANSAPDDAALDRLAAKHGIDRTALEAWFAYLGIGASPAAIDTYLTQKMERAESYDFVQGWVGADALSIVANSSDQFVRIPGDLQPHSVAVHPAPTVRVAVGWRSPIDGAVNITGRVQRAHLACGNGVAWHVELRRGITRRRLAEGLAPGEEAQAIGPLENITVQRGDLVSLVIDPRDKNHYCDLTAIDLTIVPADGGQEPWNLAKDISPDILAGNPHADRRGNADVWHFYREPVADGGGESVIPAGSLLAKWHAANDAGAKQQLASRLQALVQSNAAGLPADSPDAALYRQLTSASGPLLSTVQRKLIADPRAAAGGGESGDFGLDPALFGRHPRGGQIGSNDLCVQAPAVLEVTVPADLVAGRQFVVTGSLHTEAAADASVQMQVLTARPNRISLVASSAKPVGDRGTWTDGEKGVQYDVPILVAPGSAARERWLAAFDDFRQLFPAALCYTKIVPVDEVVTLTLFYREDNPLRRLMLNGAEAAELDRLWGDLHFVSRSPLIQVDAYEQLWQYATQDADPSVFTPMRDGILQRAAEFRTLLARTEPVHIEAVLDFAERAWRRPLTQAEREQLRGLYQQLRKQELAHDDAVRLLLARVLVAPAFLYRSEQAPPGQQPGAVSDWELATRLSYFLWSSLPDAELRELAGAGKLRQPDVLKAQVRRMLRDAKVRRLAIEFGCQWLHIRDFDQFDEKSEQHFPEFAELRSDMYEEAIRFFEDLFMRDGSVLDLLDADHTFANDRLAEFYGLPFSNAGNSDAWRRIDGVRDEHARGGVLTLGATLAKQSGASRTSPILRGTWVSEFLLGEKLPKPPQDVPVLPDEAPRGLSERQLIERHSSDPACAKCHQRIDPFGFALEGFDAIGRRRARDAGGQAIDVATVLPDGTAIEGVEGLRDYLLNQRRDDFLRTFCRRLLGYALGRSVQLSDEPLLDAMMKDLKQSDYRIAAAARAIVLSPQFRRIRGADADPETDSDD